jgi:tetratricopeptide (TPR) repeat protein
MLNENGPTSDHGRWRGIVRSHAIQIALPLLVLTLLYWGVADSGPKQPGRAPQPLSQEEIADLLTQSRARLREGRYDQALVPARQLADAFPQNPIYQETLAILYGRLKDYKQESRCWEQVVRFSPLPLEYCPQLAASYRKQGLIAETRDACDRCLKLDPDNPEMLCLLGVTEESAHRFGRAQEIYRRALQADPSSIDAGIGLARTALFTGHSAEAREAATAVLARSPDDTQALLVLGMALRAEGSLTEAKRQLNRALEIRPDDVDVHAVLGGIAEQEEDRALALQHYNKALEIDPGRREIAARRDGLMKGRR